MTSSAETLTVESGNMLIALAEKGFRLYRARPRIADRPSIHEVPVNCQLGIDDIYPGDIVVVHQEGRIYRLDVMLLLETRPRALEAILMENGMPGSRRVVRIDQSLELGLDNSLTGPVRIFSISGRIDHIYHVQLGSREPTT